MTGRATVPVAFVRLPTPIEAEPFSARGVGVRRARRAGVSVGGLSMTETLRTPRRFRDLRSWEKPLPKEIFLRQDHRDGGSVRLVTPSGAVEATVSRLACSVNPSSWGVGG